MQDNRDSAKNILERENPGFVEGEVTEFVFGTEPPEEKATEDAEFSFGEAVSFVEDSKNKGTKLNFDDSEQKERAPEFSVPERFVLDEKYNVSKGAESAPRIFTTYVPRFTDASRNYKMRDGSAPAITVQEDLSKHHEEAVREFEGDIDPTAEIDSTADTVGAVVVGAPKDEEAITSATTVFKFAVEDSEDVPETTASVTDRDGQKTPELITEVEEKTIEVPDEKVAEVREEDSSRPRVYTIPDPDGAVSVASTQASSAMSPYSAVPEDAPRDIGDPIRVLKRIKEYDAYPKRERFKERFLDKILSIKVRLFAAVVIALFALAFECFISFGVELVTILGIASVPGAVALLDALFVVALYLLSIPETVSAFASLVRKKVTSGLHLTVALIVIGVYTTLIVASAPVDYPLFGFLYSVYAICAILSSYYKASSDFVAFKRVAANGEKIVADSKMTRTLEYENVALDGKVEEYRSRTLRTFRTMFVSDFFNRASIPVGRNKSVGIVLGGSLGLSLITAVVAFFIPGGWASAASAFALVFLLGCPAFSILLNRLPSYHAQLEIDKQKSAIIGETAMMDFAATDVITFEDTEVFGSEDVSLQRINVNGHNDNLAKALRQMSALFMRVGGPLDALFSNSLDRKCSPAENVQIFDDGIIGVVDGGTVFAGNLDFMKKNGIKILPETDGFFERKSDTTKIMYAAENGEAYAKFYIRYSFSEEFSMLLPILDDYGITPLVYTRDPNVSRELLVTLTAGVDKIRVMKRSAVPSEVRYKSVSASLVSVGDRSNAINSVLIAKKYASTVNRFKISEIISMAVGGVLAAVLTIGGMTLVPSVALGAWHAIWCFACYFISKKCMRFDN